jgi:hypothetical protein
MSSSDLLKAAAKVGIAGTKMFELTSVTPLRAALQTHDMGLKMPAIPPKTTIIHLVDSENDE